MYCGGRANAEGSSKPMLGHPEKKLNLVQLLLQRNMTSSGNCVHRF